MNKLSNSPPIFIFDAPGNSVDAILDQVFEQLKTHDRVSNESIQEFEKELHKHANLNEIEHGLAVIHHKTEIIEDLEIVVRLKTPISSLSGKDGAPLRYIWILLGHETTHHHAALATEFSHLLREKDLSEEFSQVQTAEEFIALYEKGVYDDVNFEHHIPPELRPTGRFAGGLINDIKRSVSTYRVDFTDGINSKSLASVFFLFFACLAPAIAFGGLLEVQTGGAVGVTEMIVATAICGITYALFSAQPLTILGSTGPVIVFMGLLYPLCVEYNVPYLPTLACVGLWTTLFLVILALIDACSWIRFFTRFTDDTFAALISLIFIYEAVKNMLGGFYPNDAGEVDYNVAFLAVILGLGTFYIASGLSSLRGGVYLRRRIREFLADFGTTIAIGAMLIFSLQFESINISRLDVPETLEPSSIVLQDASLQEIKSSEALIVALKNNPSLLNTSDEILERINLDDTLKREILDIKPAPKETLVTKSEKRSWFVNPLDAPQWVIWLSIIPAILLSILLYLDQNITVRLVNHSQYKLKKGAGYHQDLLVVAFLVGVCSLLGLPWMVAATVRSLNHVRSLVVVDHKDGQETITGTVETRLTGLLVHTAVGASLLLLVFLKTIPMAVLFGLFLYMGVASMKGNQLFERLRLWVMDPEKYPPTYYLRAVPAAKVHVFTLIQTIALAVLWFIKASALAILFPLFIALLVPIRMILNRYFDPTHLALLDAEEEPDEEQYRENI